MLSDGRKTRRLREGCPRSISLVASTEKNMRLKKKPRKKKSPVSKTTDTHKNKMQLTLEYVKRLPLEALYRHTLNKRNRNRVYRQTENAKLKRRKLYYVKNDIFHPIHHPAGRIEKRHKKKKPSPPPPLHGEDPSFTTSEQKSSDPREQAILFSDTLGSTLLKVTNQKYVLYHCKI